MALRPPGFFLVVRRMSVSAHHLADGTQRAVNRPFVYLIQGSTTGALVFVGVLMNPV